MPPPSPIIVYGSTSVVLVNTQSLTAGQSAVVLLSSVSDPGRTVTIRDSLGYLSSPQSIVVSTMNSIRFADGTSSITLTLPYSYITVSSRDSNSWNLINTFAFPINQTIANVKELHTSSITTSNLYATDFISTGNLTTGGLYTTSTATILGPAFIRTLVVGTDPSHEIPYSTTPGYVAYIQGSLQVQSSITVLSSSRIAGSISTGSNLFVGGSVSTTGSLFVAGSITTLGSIQAPTGSLQTAGLTVTGPTSFGATATFSNDVIFQSSLLVNDSISTPALYANTLQIGSTINFQNNAIQGRATDLYITCPITVPSISTNYLTASNSITTSTLTVLQSIQAPTATFLTLSSTAITNPQGSLLISSIAAGSATFSNSVTTQALNTSSLKASTILVSGDIYASKGGYLGINTVVSDTLSAQAVYAQNVSIRNLSTSGVSLDTLFINTSMNANNLSTCYMSNVYIRNPQGSIVTGDFQTDNAFITSNFTIGSGVINAANSTLYLNASTIAIDTTYITNARVDVVTASTVQATQLVLGTTPAPPLGPSYFTVSSIATSNVYITGGPGNYLTPYTLSNIKPPTIGPGDPYPVTAAFQISWNGPVVPAFFQRVTANLFWGNELSCDLAIYSPDSTMLTHLYGLNGTNQSYTGSNQILSTPVTTALYVTGTMVGYSAFSLTFQALSNAIYSAIDTGAGITMRNGILRWPYSLNATTIQNTFNDISTRNMYYYGSLNFTSDPRLKENIEDADLARCYSTVRDIPLRRYKFKDAYLSTFQQTDAHRLGFLANEVATYFPKSVIATELDGLAATTLPSTVRTIDIQQLEMAHIGATKFLMQEVETLQDQVSAALSTMKNLMGS